jgi:hypothetical protein
MDDARFDALTKTLGTAHTRRGVTRLLGGLGLSGVLSALGTSEALAAARKGGAPCTRNSQCKTGRCVGPAGSKQCSCSRKFRACVQPADPCKQATCDFDTKLCVTSQIATGECAPCSPNCNGKNCGDSDDCDGICITNQGCDAGQACSAEGQCQLNCPAGQINCPGMDFCAGGECCGPNGAGVLCGGVCQNAICCATGGPCPTGGGQCRGAGDPTIVCGDENRCCFTSGRSCSRSSEGLTCCSGTCRELPGGGFQCD